MNTPIVYDTRNDAIDGALTRLRVCFTVALAGYCTFGLLAWLTDPALVEFAHAVGGTLGMYIGTFINIDHL